MTYALREDMVILTINCQLTWTFISYCVKNTVRHKNGFCTEPSLVDPCTRKKKNNCI